MNCLLRPVENFLLLINNVNIIENEYSKCNLCKSKCVVSIKRKKNRKTNDMQTLEFLGTSYNCEVCIVKKYIKILKDNNASGKFHKQIFFIGNNYTVENLKQNFFYSANRKLAKLIGINENEIKEYKGYSCRR
jgi:hypothetical protein